MKQVKLYTLKEDGNIMILQDGMYITLTPQECVDIHF